MIYEKKCNFAAGFPITSDYPADRLDFNRDFIKHPESTFYVRVKGDSMKEAGIFDGDLCLVDKAEEIIAIVCHYRL